MKKTRPSLNLFSDKTLVALISVVTLLLQLISFATTWNGSKVYLEGIFPYASLLFALAIQATAYFLSNSLRNRVSFLKTAALFCALCCSTYYSYIGIYNSVNSPESYLQKNYVRISNELTQLFDNRLETGISVEKEAVEKAASLITSRYAALIGEQANIASCKEALENISASYTEDLRAPKMSAYENYEDYVAAYNAYIAGISAGSNTETEAARTQVLSAYGFSSIQELNEAALTNNAALTALTAALPDFTLSDSAPADSSLSDSALPDTFPAAVNTARVQLITVMEEASAGILPDSTDTALLNSFFQASALCGYDDLTTAEIINTINLCAGAASSPLLSDYSALTARLPEGRVTAKDTLELKAMMDSEILSALIRINTLLPETAPLSFSDSRFQITDLYLVPIKALGDGSSRMTALFCLFVAALIDSLSVLFAVSLRRRKPLCRRRTLLFSNFEDFEPQIYASLPKCTVPSDALAGFLANFRSSPQTEADGYMMLADINTLNGYHALSALLCQINLAKTVPAGLYQNEADVLLLKARFVFWANTVIYESRLETDGSDGSRETACANFSLPHAAQKRGLT